MTTERTCAATGRLLAVSRGTAAIAAVMGLAALAGWTAGLAALKSAVPGLVAMNPATAVAFLLAGAALWLLRANEPSRPMQLTARACALLVVAVGLLKVSGYLCGWDGGIDRLLFRGTLGANRMAPNTAAYFVLLGAALLVLDRGARGWLAAQLLASGVGIGALLALIGYSYGAAPLYGVASYIPMALNTALAFGALAVGVLTARPGQGIAATIASPRAGGQIARRLLPAAVLIPWLLGWLRLLGQRAGLYGTEFGSSLMVSLTVFLLAALILGTVRRLNRADADRARAEDELRLAHSTLEQRVQERTAELSAANEALRAEMAERNRAVAAEREAEEQFRLLVEGVREYAILMLDPAGRIASWNAGAERIKGWRADEIIGQHFSRFYRSEDRQSHRPEHDLRTAATEGRLETEGLRVRKDGSQYWADVVITPLRNPNGELYGFAKVTRDVTDRRRADEQIRRLNADLAAQLATLFETNRELEQQIQENETFVYSVSHDLRSPLVNLQGFSKELGLVCEDLRAILTGSELPPAVAARGLALVNDEMGESIRFIQAGVMRLSHIIDALLRLSRVGRVEYRPQRLDVRDIVQRVIEAASGTIADRGATVTLQDLPPAWGDATAIEQVFGNLIGNALKYLDLSRPGEIAIGTADPAEIAGMELPEMFQTYVVRDNGLGIAEAYQAKVFQAFQRVHAQVAPGEGMGLTIVRRIVERHGGRVWVRSAAGEGSAFFVALPSKPPSATRQGANDMDVQERNRADGERTVDHSAGGR